MESKSTDIVPKTEDYDHIDDDATAKKETNDKSTQLGADTRKLARIKALKLALMSCVFSLVGIAIFICFLMVFGNYKESNTLIVATTILGGAITAIVGVIAGTSID